MNHYGYPLHTENHVMFDQLNFRPSNPPNVALDWPSDNSFDYHQQYASAGQQVSNSYQENVNPIQQAYGNMGHKPTTNFTSDAEAFTSDGILRFGSTDFQSQEFTFAVDGPLASLASPPQTSFFGNLMNSEENLRHVEAFDKFLLENIGWGPAAQTAADHDAGGLHVISSSIPIHEPAPRVAIARLFNFEDLQESFDSHLLRDDSPELRTVLSSSTPTNTSSHPPAPSPSSPGRASRVADDPEYCSNQTRVSARAAVPEPHDAQSTVTATSLGFYHPPKATVSYSNAARLSGGPFSYTAVEPSNHLIPSISRASRTKRAYHSTESEAHTSEEGPSSSKRRRVAIPAPPIESLGNLRGTSRSQLSSKTEKPISTFFVNCPLASADDRRVQCNAEVGGGMEGLLKHITNSHGGLRFDSSRRRYICPFLSPEEEMGNHSREYPKECGKVLKDRANVMKHLFCGTEKKHRPLSGVEVVRATNGNETRVVWDEMAIMKCPRCPKTFQTYFGGCNFSVRRHMDPPDGSKGNGGATITTRRPKCCPGGKGPEYKAKWIAKIKPVKPMPRQRLEGYNPIAPPVLIPIHPLPSILL